MSLSLALLLLSCGSVPPSTADGAATYPHGPAIEVIFLAVGANRPAGIIDFLTVDSDGVIRDLNGVVLLPRGLRDFLRANPTGNDNTLCIELLMRGQPSKTTVEKAIANIKQAVHPGGKTILFVRQPAVPAPRAK
jgi:hypothetical protein